MLNCSVYIFGDFGHGHTQFPDDYARDIFERFRCQEFHQQVSYKSQMAIHRDGNLMYYGYVRKLKKNSQYIGFCILLNGAMFTTVHRLFPLFENAVEKMILMGQIIGFDESGSFVSMVDKLSDEPQEVISLADMIRRRVDKMEAKTKPLPPVNYAVSKTKKTFFSMEASDSEVVEASVKYSFVYVGKDKQYDTSALRDHASTIKTLYKEKNDLLSQYHQLEIRYNNLNRQKKQYRNVVILCVVLALCGVGLFFLKDSLDSTKISLGVSQRQNAQKQKKITQLNDSLGGLRANVRDLTSSLASEKYKCGETERKLRFLKEFVSKQQPLIIKNTSFDFSTGRLSFDYYGLCNKEITLKVKAYSESSTCSNWTTLNIWEGEQSSSIYVNNSLVRSEWYSFELMLGDKIIGRGRH